MRKDDLISYLNRDIKAEYLSSIMKEEVDNYRKQLLKRGASIPIVFDGDSFPTVLSYEHLQVLGTDFLNDKLDLYTLSYIVDALLLSENTSFENEALREHFEELTDFEINGVLTKERIRDILGE